MAVVSVNETMPWGAGGEFAIADSVDSLSLTRSFVVILDGTDANEDVPYVAISAAGIPNKGDAHPDSGYSDARCDNLSVELTESWTVVIVICEYSTSGGSAGRHDAIDPVNDPWEIDFPNSSSREPVERTVLDVSGGSWAANETGVGADELVADAAGSPFSPRIQETFYPGRIVCSKNVNVSDIDFDEIKEYRGSINTHTIIVAGYEIAVWEGRLTGFFARFMDERGKIFYKITYGIDLKDDLWVRRVVNQGMKIKTSTGDTANATNANSSPLQKPIHLSTDGLSTVAPTDANYRVFGLIKGKNWNSLTTVPPTSLPSA